MKNIIFGTTLLIGALVAGFFIHTNNSFAENNLPQTTTSTSCSCGEGCGCGKGSACGCNGNCGSEGCKSSCGASCMGSSCMKK